MNGISDEKVTNKEMIVSQLESVLDDLFEAANCKKGDVLVVGCSSSEVAGKNLGTFSSKEIGEIIADTLLKKCENKGIYLAAQCCEHLNRALVIEKQLAEKKNLEIVSVVPKLKAGGSFGTATYLKMKDAVMVEHIKADMGIDIGDTLIGMHLKDVAVPVRCKLNSIGMAHVVCARTRPKYIGGERAEYTL